MYTFPIPNTKIRFYQVFAYGILLLNMVGMSMIVTANKNSLASIIIPSFIFVAMVIWDLNAYKKGHRLLPVGILLLAYGVFWIRFGANWAFLANLVLWLLYTISKRKMAVRVSAEEIIYPSYPKKIFLWSELNNVILKDDLLTIDCKNNKVYQHFIQNSEQFADEIVFNNFCRNQLQK